MTVLTVSSEIVPAENEPDGGTDPRDGRDTRWESHRASRRAELVRAVRRAVHRGGPDMSMDDIAQAIGTSKPVLYRYFADRTGLQMAVGELVISDMRRALRAAAIHAPSPREGLAAMVATYLDMVAASPNVYYFVTRPAVEARSGSLTGFVGGLADLLAQSFAEVLRPTAADAAAWAAGTVGFVRGVGDWWLAHRDEPDHLDVAETTDKVAEWLWTGPPLT